MKIRQLLFMILMVISCQAKFNAHINQKDLPIKKSKSKESSSTDSKETNEQSNDKTDDDVDDKNDKQPEEQPYSYQWQAFKGVVFNRDINPFAKLGKSFSDHAAKRKEKAEKKKAKNSSDTESENKQDNADSKEIAADNSDAKIKNEEK
jgi:hypothetical protein